jgi:Flp pilus assembly protein TadG
MGSRKSYVLSVRRGVAAAYSILMLVALCGLVSMGVDLGRVQLAKTELRSAADAAARAGAAGLASSVSQCKTDAVAVAAANLCDGSSVALDSTQDIEVGFWFSDSRTFVPVTGVLQNWATAVRVHARRTSARGNPIPLTFARLVGRSTCDINAFAVATVAETAGRGYVGLNSVTTNNNANFVSYNSSVNSNPTVGSASSNTMVGTNGTIGTGNNSNIRGDVLLGPSGSVSGSPNVTGNTKNLSSPIPAPSSPAWAPGTNPGGISQNYTVNSNTTLPGGTYWFTSLAINADLTFSGVATVYINGNASVSDNINAFQNVPSNLKIYQIGNRTFGDANANGVTITAQIEAPNSTLTFKNNFTMRGMATFEDINVKNDATFFYDEAAGPAGTVKSITLVN